MTKVVPAMQSRRVSMARLLAACLLVLVGLLLWSDNPTVNVSASDGDSGHAGEVDRSIGVCCTVR